MYKQSLHKHLNLGLTQNYLARDFEQHAAPANGCVY